MTSDGSLFLRRLAQLPGLFGQIAGAHVDSTRIFNELQHQLVIIAAPMISAYSVGTVGIVIQLKPIAFHLIRRNAAPPGLKVEDPHDPLFKLQFPDSPFRDIIRAPPAGYMGMRFGVEFNIGPVDGGSNIGRKRFIIRVWRSLEQLIPSLGDVRINGFGLPGAGNHRQVDQKEDAQPIHRQN